MIPLLIAAFGVFIYLYSENNKTHKFKDKYDIYQIISKEDEETMFSTTCYFNIQPFGAYIGDPTIRVKVTHEIYNYFEEGQWITL